MNKQEAEKMWHRVQSRLEAEIANGADDPDLNRLLRALAGLDDLLSLRERVIRLELAHGISNATWVDAYRKN